MFETLPNACLVWLIRHGATPHNMLRPPRMQGRRIDQSLSDLGRQQAGRVAGLLAARPIAAVYASPLKRSMETAGLIAELHDQAIEPVEELMEVNVGDWEDLSWDDIAKNHPEAYANFRRDPVTHGYPGGENMQQAIDRVHAAIAGIAREHAASEIVVVAHSVVIRCYLGKLLGLGPAEGRRIPQTNCSANLVQIAEDKAKVVTINSVGHLM